MEAPPAKIEEPTGSGVEPSQLCLADPYISSPEIRQRLHAFFCCNIIPAYLISVSTLSWVVLGRLLFYDFMNEDSGVKPLTVLLMVSLCFLRILPDPVSTYYNVVYNYLGFLCISSSSFIFSC